MQFNGYFCTIRVHREAQYCMRSRFNDCRFSRLVGWQCPYSWLNDQTNWRAVWHKEWSPVFHHYDRRGSWSPWEMSVKSLVDSILMYPVQTGKAIGRAYMGCNFWTGMRHVLIATIENHYFTVVKHSVLTVINKVWAELNLEWRWTEAVVRWSPGPARHRTQTRSDHCPWRQRWLETACLQSMTAVISIL